jgi:spermidine synthase
MLTHGRIRHGMQLSDPARARWPTMYFGPGTAVAQVLSEHAAGRARHIGIVGLGVGTLAAYGGERDRLRFYELDPNVLELAQRYFTFLRDTPARSSFVLGDGRLSLARESSQRFDVLVLDAFASDAVPAHLLTREAFAIYLRQLAPDGVLLANVSNRHLAVDRVVRGAARAHGLGCAVVETPANVARFVSKVRWAILTRDAAQLARELTGLVQATPSGADVLWTDARASVWSILK